VILGFWVTDSDIYYCPTAGFGNNTYIRIIVANIIIGLKRANQFLANYFPEYAKLFFH
jgi:hypothetical protein